jgi:nitrite reductase/ring-hydroxylating ferredoxin subunit
MKFQRAMALKDIPRGQMRACLLLGRHGVEQSAPDRLGAGVEPSLTGREIVLCHTKHGIFALDNICTHAHARMNEGRLRGVRLICPLHGASFDVRDGRVLGAPATVPLSHHAVRVVEGFVEVALDHSTLNQSTSA